MEKTLGIEAARARLGDIADHARTTGQVTHLTRHGRTVAVIGPAHAVQPAGNVKVMLFVGDEDGRPCALPAVPRIGDTFRLFNDEDEDSFWLVVAVQWDLGPNGEAEVNVLLDPHDVRTAERDATENADHA
ncbi:type II toxin-antitoxin system Phd/YefM family antitoxin [Streptomyces xinghaiensis]|uniref:type II toxin-antitoxin system Phd/YefM family antitoxin n=1 Tax=Streptomyces xinghaiensis TaxID=1038928 RepID=UPI000594B0C9|nr:type II toxin-antitoxin system Phd/YefM family antitoxin [Streptomyces xinghaiensis]MZE76803.1 hypothetical protein [Streptomyces sp. SID5475]